MIKTVTNQRGMAMVLELLLVAAVLVVVGFAGYHAYQAHNQQPHTAAKADTTPNGKVTNAVNALNASAQSEVDASTNEATSISDADSSASDVSNVEGSFDANQF